MLRAGDAPPLDYAAFLDQCQGAVSDRVYRSLESVQQNLCTRSAGHHGSQSQN